MIDTADADELFAKAESEVADQIHLAVVAADGDPRRALRELLEWARGSRARRLSLLRSTRYRLEDDRPQFEGVIDRVFAEHGEDVEGACAAFAELVNEHENPTLRESLDKELGAAAAVAIHTWVEQECQSWREEHAP